MDTIHQAQQVNTHTTVTLTPIEVKAPGSITVNVVGPGISGQGRSHCQQPPRADRPRPKARMVVAPVAAISNRRK
jgi:hypothetical protein